jgi:hypothetical protein
MKALSVRQPWASLLVAGQKRFEVRRRNLREPGRYLIHASGAKAWGIRDLRKNPLLLRALARAGLEDEAAWPRSAIVGVVEFGRIWGPRHRRPAMSEMQRFLCGPIAGHYLWEVRRCWTFDEPIPADGKLNLWEPSLSVRAKVAEEFLALL